MPRSIHSAQSTLLSLLREDLDLHSAFTYEKFLSQGVDAHFNARKLEGGAQVSVKPSDFWKQLTPEIAVDGEFKCPASAVATVAYSKNIFNLASFRTKTPAFTKDTQGAYWGFEDGGQVGTGIALFYCWYDEPVDRFGVIADGLFSEKVFYIDAALPVNARTALHRYGVALLRPWAEFYIDGLPVAYVLNSTHLAFTDVNYPPYGISSGTCAFATKQLGMIGLEGLEQDLVFPLAPSLTRYGHIAELPPRVFRLYDAGTKVLFAGLAIAAGSEISHPVPVFGYSKKTLFFQATQAGTLLLEVLMETGNWRTYDSLSILANTLLAYLVDGKAVLMRVTFTPGSYPATISEAEMILDD